MTTVDRCYTARRAIAGWGLGRACVQRWFDRHLSRGRSRCDWTAGFAGWLCPRRNRFGHAGVGRSPGGRRGRLARVHPLPLGRLRPTSDAGPARPRRVGYASPAAVVGSRDRQGCRQRQIPE